MTATPLKERHKENFLVHVKDTFHDDERMDAEQITRAAFRTKPNGIRVVQQGCHPERSEGSRTEILRCAQNDSPEELHGKVYECFALWLSAQCQ